MTGTMIGIISRDIVLIVQDVKTSRTIMAKQDKSELQKAADAVRAAEEHRELCAELVKDAIANCNTAKLELARCEKILDECTDNLYTARNNVTRSIQHVQLITKMGSNSPHGWDQKEVVCGNNTHSLF